ncbi:hypothetical protein PG997_009108 [Apiospora hydei]|uniref:Uncharacterized protein n=1 Tax=Apiospora hydei TaxID=1337664 RepID=A0ABR1VT50_9PEZI
MAFTYGKAFVDTWVLILTGNGCTVHQNPPDSDPDGGGNPPRRSVGPHLVQEQPGTARRAIPRRHGHPRQLDPSEPGEAVQIGDRAARGARRQGLHRLPGRKYRAKQIVYFTMMGRDQKTYWDKYYIASEKSNIDVILGEEFVNSNGRARDVCDTGPHAAPARVFVLDSKITKTDKEQMDAGKAKNDREAQELAERKKRRSQRDREGKTSGEESKSRKRENN